MTNTRGRDTIRVQKEKETPQTGKEKIMLEMICAIPENIGWTIVGATSMLALLLVVKVGSLLIQSVRDHIEVWREEREEEGSV